MGIMCASQMAVQLACFSYQKIRGVLMIYRECGSELSFQKDMLYFFFLVSVRLTFWAVNSFN